MKLKSFGCSFVFGTDLPNDGRWSRMATPSDHAWPALIAKELDMEFECHARPGAGNFEICQRIINEIARESCDVFLVNWTWIDRFSWIDEKLYNHHPLNAMGWRSIMPVDVDERAQFYYRLVHTQIRDKMETLSSIKLAIDACRQANVRFVMTWTDNLIWETEWHAPPSIIWLQDQIRPCLEDFQGRSFVDWSRFKGFKISDTMHPLVEAHQAAADLWLPRVRDIIGTIQRRA